MDSNIYFKKNKKLPGANPNYLRGRDQEDQSLKPGRENSS
jgi:hypothetical protein